MLPLLLSMIGGPKHEQGLFWFGLNTHASDRTPTIPVRIERKIDVRPIRELELSTIATDIKLIPYDGGKAGVARVSLEGRFPVKTPGAALRADTDGPKLRISTQEEAGEQKMMALESYSKALTLFMPRVFFETLRTLTVNTVSGEAKIAFPKTHHLTLKTVSGNIRFHGNATDSFSSSAVSGDIQGDGLSAPEISGETVSGNIDLKLLSVKPNARIHSISGKVSLTLPSKARVEIQTKTVSGEKLIDAGVSEKSYHAGMISIDTVSGSIKIRK